MTGTEALTQAVARLRAAGVDDPARDARGLLAHVLELPAGRLTLHLPDDMADAQLAAFTALTARRANREPVSHLIGTRAFYGREFSVTAAVLDPRPETETLIEQALARDFSTVLDLGTGSGCILLTLLAERPHAQGTGTDLSPEALAIAAQNAKRLSVQGRAGFAQGTWFEAVAAEATFDLIVSNPPYIAVKEMADLAPELGHEPRMALTDEDDGLTAYRAIARAAPRHLSPGGRLLVEIGPTQAAAVTALFSEAGLADLHVQRDLDGRDRVVGGVFLPQTRTGLTKS